MFSKVLAGGIHGIDSYLAQIEVDVSQGMPGFEMVGLPGSEVREARERVRVALKNSAFKPPISQESRYSLVFNADYTSLPNLKCISAVPLVSELQYILK